MNMDNKNITSKTVIREIFKFSYNYLNNQHEKNNPEMIKAIAELLKVTILFR